MYKYICIYTSIPVCVKKGTISKHNFLKFLSPPPLLVKVDEDTDWPMRLSKKRYHFCESHLGSRIHCNIDSKGGGPKLSNTGFFKWYLFSHTPEEGKLRKT